MRESHKLYFKNRDSEFCFRIFFKNERHISQVYRVLQRQLHGNKSKFSRRGNGKKMKRKILVKCPKGWGRESPEISECEDDDGEEKSGKKMEEPRRLNKKNDRKRRKTEEGKEEDVARIWRDEPDSLLSKTRRLLISNTNRLRPIFRRFSLFWFSFLLKTLLKNVENRIALVRGTSFRRHHPVILFKTEKMKEKMSKVVFLFLFYTIDFWIILSLGTVGTACLNIFGENYG